MKLTKEQRSKLVSPDLRQQITEMSDDLLLAAHDLMHDEMERRHGTKNRAALSQATGGKE